MRRTEMLQEIRKMRFEEVYSEWSESRLSQEEAALIPGVPGTVYLDNWGQSPYSFQPRIGLLDFRVPGTAKRSSV